MTRIVTVAALALCIGFGTAFAQDVQKKGPPRERPKVEDVFKTMDTNHDGKVTLEEFVGKAKDNPDRAKAMEERFKAIDTKDNGYITLDEFKAYWEKHAADMAKHHHGKRPQKESPAPSTQPAPTTQPTPAQS